MRRHHHRRAARQRVAIAGTDARIRVSSVIVAGIVLRDVQVRADEHALAADVDVGEALEFHALSDLIITVCISRRRRRARAPRARAHRAARPDRGVVRRAAMPARAAASLRRRAPCCVSTRRGAMLWILSRLPVPCASVCRRARRLAPRTRVLGGPPARLRALLHAAVARPAMRARRRARAARPPRLSRPCPHPSAHSLRAVSPAAIRPLVRSCPCLSALRSSLRPPPLARALKPGTGGRPRATSPPSAPLSCRASDWRIPTRCHTSSRPSPAGPTPW